MCQICFLESEAHFQQPLELDMYLWSMGQSADSGAEVKRTEHVSFLFESKIFKSSAKVKTYPALYKFLSNGC